MGRQPSKANNRVNITDPSIKMAPQPKNARLPNPALLTTTNLKPVEIQKVGPLSRWLGNVSIRWVLTVPFIIQTVVAVGIVGYISYFYSQRAVQSLVGNLQTEIGVHIKEQLDNYLKIPHTITQMNQKAYELGFLDVEDLDRMQQYFHQQMQLERYLGYVNFGHRNGQFIGVGREDSDFASTNGNDDTPLYVERITPDAPGELQKYWLNDEGDRTQLSEEIAYEPREDTWYTAALETDQPIWTDPYQWPDQPGVYSISASYPIYQDSSDPDTFLGVLGADFILSQLNQFLAELSPYDAGEIFIMEQSTGELIASSSGVSPFALEDEAKQLRASMTEDGSLVDNTAEALEDIWGGFIPLDEAISLELKLASPDTSRKQLQYVRVIPWNDDWGLNWLIVVVIPRTEVMGDIDQGNVRAAILCFLALGGAIALGIRTARWITQPILFLNNAAKSLAGGEWNQAFVLQRSDEVGELAQSFNDMARQLRHSFRDLETQKNSFARFFPSEYLTFLNKPDVTDVALGDHVSREMTVMFSDIRGFTSMSEAMTPGETFDFVNTYLEEVAPAVRLHNGVIVKFLGDGMMAVFPDSADSAIQAGIDTFKCLNAYNQRRQQQDLSTIHLGIGVHVGHMMVGIVGERNRMQADALSDTVNLTARLEGLTKFYGVSLLVSDQVVDDLSDMNHYQLRFLGEAIVKGRKEPIGLYEVVDVDEESDRALKAKTYNQFEGGVAYYRSGDLLRAKGCFEEILSIHPQDKVAARFLSQTTAYLNQGKPEDWDGVWRFTTK
ncbi:MAG: HAMP domain-containing protein [Merismopedia sp. SIO2A8]|nr:HAMP domain-containing protein [Merismopedia sp. SIO2A8]